MKESWDAKFRLVIQALRLIYIVSKGYVNQTTLGCRYFSIQT